MRIAFDDQIFVTQTRGGISRYFTQLMKEFDSESGVTIETPFRYVLNEHLAEAYASRYRQLPRPYRLPVRPFLDVLNRSRRRTAAAVDLVHHTYYRASHLADYPGAARVCTIYDMIPELFPDLFPLGNPHREKQEFTEACDAILCISETTKKDLVRIYGEADKPTIVTYLGVDARFFARSREAPLLDHPYVLFVGARKGYKNFSLLAHAFSRLNGHAHDLRLVCVGGGAFTPNESDLLTSLNIRQRAHQFSPTDATLPSFYAQASVFCFPSRYEGFGLPLVEAFAAGCPVAIADTPCLVEIADDAAEVVDPDDAAQLAETLQRMVFDQALRDRLIAAGRSRASDFTWQSTARKTANAYRDVLAQVGP